MVPVPVASPWYNFIFQTRPLRLRGIALGGAHIDLLNSTALASFFENHEIKDSDKLSCEILQLVDNIEAGDCCSKYVADEVKGVSECLHHGILYKLQNLSNKVQRKFMKILYYMFVIYREQTGLET